MSLQVQASALEAALGFPISEGPKTRLQISYHSGLLCLEESPKEAPRSPFWELQFRHPPLASFHQQNLHKHWLCLFLEFWLLWPSHQTELWRFWDFFRQTAWTLNPKPPPGRFWSIPDYRSLYVISHSMDVPLYIYIYIYFFIPIMSSYSIKHPK